MALEVASALAHGLIWLGELFARGLAGWRFVLSPAYRAQTRERWRREPSMQMTLEITGAAVGILLTLAALWGAWQGMLSFFTSVQ